MASLIQTLVSVGTAFSVLSTGLYFIVKLLINKSFEAGMERYKLSLQQDLEAHKMKLQLTNHKFTKLHEAQCNALNEIFISITTYKDAMREVQRNAEQESNLTTSSLIKLLANLKGNIEKVEQAYQKNRILLPEDLSNKIFNTTELMHGAIIPVILQVIDNSQVSPEILAEFKVVLEKIDTSNVISNLKVSASPIERSNASVEQSLTALATEFRKIYGVS